MSFMFTVIISPQNNCNDLIDTLDSLFNQIIDLKYIQFIFLKDDKSFKKYQKLYPENVSICNKEDLSMKNIDGNYIHFSDLTNLYSKNAFSSVYNFILKNDYLDIISCGKNNQIIDLKDNYKHSINEISNLFIKKSILNNQSIFGIVNDSDFFYLNKLLLSNDKLGIVKVDLQKKNPMIITHDWFSNRVLQYKQILEYSNSDQGKYYILNDLNNIINDKSFNQIDYPETFKEDLKDILSNIDDEIIKKHEKLKKNIKSLLLYIKNNDFHVEIKKDKLFLKTGKYVINGLHGHAINLDIVDIKNNYLNLSGYFKSSCDPKNLEFEAVLSHSNGDEEIYTAVKIEYPTTERARNIFFGIEFTFTPCFDFKIPINRNDDFKINFRIVYHENDHEKILLNNKLKFKSYCNLSNLSNYFIKDNHIVFINNNSIHVINYSLYQCLKLEIKSVKNIIKSDEVFKWYSIYIRIIYYILFFFWKNKRIWLFADRLFVADDNAKHLFLYAINQDDNIKKYYILDKNSKDFEKMKKISKNIVPFGSLKHKMLYLFSEKFISSHSGNSITNPFYKYNENLFCGLTTIEKVFLQHGITIHDVSYWLRKYRHNFYLLVTSSDYEQKSFITGNYNYSSDIVKTLGFPRYDNLNNQDLKKEILFMPTWRKGINSEEDFLNSQYYKGITLFLNNEKLLNLLNKHDFKIVFKPHFEILQYVHLFDFPSEVELSIDASYQELFNSSMILITDYSSVFFDFAYLKKPIIYYRYDDNFHYDPGYFNFETMGFGEIIRKEEDLIIKIEEYLSNDCKMETKYIKRVDDFFKYNDNDNCKRVYNFLYDIK